LRGIEAKLNRGLIGGLAEVRQEVAYFLLAGIDDLPSGGRVDGGGDLLAQLLETAAQLLQENVGGKARFGRHRGLLPEEGRKQGARHLRRGFLSK
jgi:hypothetical protein